MSEMQAEVVKPRNSQLRDIGIVAGLLDEDGKPCADIRTTLSRRYVTTRYKPDSRGGAPKIGGHRIVFVERSE